MSDTVTVALISAGSSALVAVVALILNYRGFASIDARFTALEGSINSRFASIDSRFASLEASINSRFASIEHRLEVIESDIKQFYRLLTEYDKRISRLEDKQ
jgi:hypothetical protein